MIEIKCSGQIKEISSNANLSTISFVYHSEAHVDDENIKSNISLLCYYHHYNFFSCPLLGKSV